ncbi:MAG: reverse transcriptase domain-containing protein, partial [Alphaproteobacteria bacterium]|nr:reverse transcriptase domain-containing protein [Alphaproteobacteria bacterium]
SEYLRKKLTPRQSSAPQIYGLPKIHKAEVPLRPIVCTIGSPTYDLAKELARVLSPLSGGTSSFVKNSTHFVETISSVKIDSKDCLVSFDVKSLFTQVPVEDALVIIKDRLEHDESLSERTAMTPQQVCSLTELCLKSTYFMYGDQFFEQSEGTAMGSPLSPVVAGLFMEDFEQTALVTADREPKLWLRYVDDTFIIWPHGRTQLVAFLNHLNNLCEKIQFTMEVEEENQLPFLDVLVRRNGDSLSTSVYRKKTHTDRYVHFRSHHHPQVKTSVVSCLKSRAEQLCTGDGLAEELNHLSRVFQANGYPHAVTAGALNKRRRRPPTRTEDETQKMLVLPYVKGLSERIRLVCRSLNIKTAFRSSRTLRSFLTHVKAPTPQEEQKCVVYRVPCECGSVYIGETGRQMRTHIEEHKKAVLKADPNNAIATHVWNTGHKIQWNESACVDRDVDWYRRRVK